MGYDLVIRSPRGEILSEDEWQSLLEVLWKDTILDGLCELTNLRGDIDDFGQALFLLKLPHDEFDVREAYNITVEFAKQHRLRVDDPQAGYEIDLERPGEFPPRWNPKPRSIFTIFRWLIGRK
jgi:hypothetical protein